jgi:hypothetical protein
MPPAEILAVPLAKPVLHEVPLAKPVLPVAPLAKPVVPAALAKPVLPVAPLAKPVVPAALAKHVLPVAPLVEPVLAASVLSMPVAPAAKPSAVHTTRSFCILHNCPLDVDVFRLFFLSERVSGGLGRAELFWKEARGERQAAYR